MLQKSKYFLEKQEITENELEELRNVIRYFDNEYYVKNSSQIQDKDYDYLFRLLKNYENQNPDSITITSPTQRISQNIQDSFQSRKHIIPMLSLDNTYNQEDLLTFDKQVKDSLEETPYEYLLELKFDGISICLTYEKGILTHATTRGNGTEGEEITQNIKTIYSIPLEIDTKEIDIIEIRGEIIMPKKSFIEINKKLEEDGKKTYVNARNAASGAVRQLDPNITKSRKLDAYFYQITPIEKTNNKSYEETVEYLERLGFKTSPFIKKFKNINNLIKECIDHYKLIDNYPFEIDGLVLKINSYESHQKLGSTAHHPKWAIAYKFPAQQAQTKIKNIDIQVGRTGVLTPVAVLEPVFLSGVNIQKATLHNQDEIDKKDIRIGDTVVIERAGEVIPSIIEVIKEKRPSNSNKFQIPDKCPICNSKTDKLPEEVAIRCLNINCPAQIKRRLSHFCSKNCMDIEGLGEKLIDKFVDLAILKNFQDIYMLDSHKFDIAQIEGFGGKSIQNLFDSIEASKVKPLWRIIHGLGIKYIGKQVSKILAKNVKHILELSKFTEEEFLEMEDVGIKTVESIKEFFDKAENIETIKKLEELGVNLSYIDENAGILDKTSFVITGSFDLLKRSEIEKLIEENGGKLQSGISKNTDKLICGESPGSKLQKANDLNISVISEKEFLKLINYTIKEDKSNQIEQDSMF